MTKLNFLLIVFLLALLTGCGSFPRTPELLRENVTGGKFYTSKDFFKVKRPFSKVSSTYKKQAAKCLNKEINKVWFEGGMTRRTTTRYVPKIKITSRKTILTIQDRKVSGSKELGSPPADGFYRIVADVTPISKNVTSVKIYKQHPALEPVIMALRDWATGKNLECPDFTK
ncbi:MAG: hypothetical protein ABFS18_09515 [Thermodesulfobacteriota bacterium]